MSDCFDSVRLQMRPQRVDDADALFEAYSDAGLMHHWSSAPHHSVEETRTYLTPKVEMDDWRGWSITLTGADRAIGTLAAGMVRPGVMEIGYLLARRFWHQGYAREAVSRLIDKLFVEEGARRIWADTDPDNAASNGLLERLGFKREGLLREEWETHIGVRDSIIWGLLHHEWRP